MLVMEQVSFPIYNFSEALSNLMAGHDIEREDTRLRLNEGNILMVLENGTLCPWLPTHKDILANDWKVIKLG